ncbi:MAG TPA: tetratricopeptide repeat protein [Candidatus Eisenbacteria bacterium]|nr:tetratricopeptide repeat protein [Candidatus Eisenbacteria bacterium]
MSTSTSKRRRAARDQGTPALGRPAAAIVLWVALITLAVLRAALATPGSMAAWGFSLLRFAPGALSWSLWVVGLALLVPGIARAASRWAQRIAPRGILAAVLMGVTLAALVLGWPDRLHFVGDFLLREGASARSLKPSGLFPQALPLDVFLHHGLPRAMADAWSVPTAVTERALGALEAALIGVLGYGYARTLRMEGASALAIAAVTALGGFLGIYTGYSKAIAEITLLTLALGLFALRALESPRWLFAVGLTVAVSVILHRSALALLPAAALATVLAWRRDSRRIRDPLVVAGLLAGVVMSAIMLPRIVGTMLRFDPVHFTPLEPGAHGALGALTTGTRLLDLINVMGLVSPLAMAIPIVAVAIGRRVLTSPVGWVLATLALPWIGMTLLIHPPQGMFRDWDNYSAAGIALSMIAAWLVVESGAHPRRPGLILAAALAAAGPSLSWLALNADVDRGLARIHAYLAEPPRRSDAERARVWDFLGIRNAQLARWDASAEAMARAAETAPSPRVLLQWALAEQARGRSATARDVFRRVTEIQPADARAWYGLAAESWNLGDYDECRRAALRLEQLSPGSPEARQLLESLERIPSPDGSSER